MTESITRRMYFSGEKPQNPLRLDKVYILSDIREEEPHVQYDDAGGSISISAWSAVVDEVISYAEYDRRREEEIAMRFEEVYGGLLELAAGGA